MAMPIAASLSPAVAVGAVWLGMVGGGYPDWFDLRSDFSRRLKHRGISHSVFLGALFTAVVYAVLGILDAQFHQISVDDTEIRSLALAFGAGFLSHILADTCTHAGVRLFLPFNSDKWWILPPFLRSKSDGVANSVVSFLAMLVIVLLLIRYVSQQTGWI